MARLTVAFVHGELHSSRCYYGRSRPRVNKDAGVDGVAVG